MNDTPYRWRRERPRRQKRALIVVPSKTGGSIHGRNGSIHQLDFFGALGGAFKTPMVGNRCRAAYQSAARPPLSVRGFMNVVEALNEHLPVEVFIKLAPHYCRVHNSLSKDIFLLKSGEFCSFHSQFWLSLLTFSVVFRS